MILDNIAIKDDNSIRKIISTKSAGFGCAIAGDDLLSLCDGNEKLFNSILGDSKNGLYFTIVRESVQRIGRLHSRSIKR